MTVTRATVGRLRAQIKKARALMPPVCGIVEIDDDESREAFEARVEETKRKLAAIEATGRRTAILVIDMGDE